MKVFNLNLQNVFWKKLILSKYITFIGQDPQSVVIGYLNERLRNFSYSPQSRPRWNLVDSVKVDALFNITSILSLV